MGHVGKAHTRLDTGDSSWARKGLDGAPLIAQAPGAQAPGGEVPGAPLSLLPQAAAVAGVPKGARHCDIAGCAPRLGLSVLWPLWRTLARAVQVWADAHPRPVQGPACTDWPARRPWPRTSDQVLQEVQGLPFRKEATSRDARERGTRPETRGLRGPQLHALSAGGDPACQSQPAQLSSQPTGSDPVPEGNRGRSPAREGGWDSRVR